MAHRPFAQPPGKSRFRPAALIALLVGGCVAQPPLGPGDPIQHRAEDTIRVPAFARMQFEPFTRADALAIVLREWRGWGQLVNDEPPDERPPPAAEDKPERMPGLWERVGEYWWLGMDAGRPEADWTGKHDGNGTEFDSLRDGEYAWSAAFISYVMRTAGAGSRFPYSASHVTYINAARDMSLQRTTNWVVSAERADAAVPKPGDLICYARGGRSVRFEDLPARHFASHCDMVVSVTPGQLSVVGGNVFDAVTMKHVPVTADGTLAPPGGRPLDSRYAWFVVLRVLYDR